MQSKTSGQAAELESCSRQMETKCTGIRKEVSKAMAEQRQQLNTQSDSLMKKMDAVSSKVSFLVYLSTYLPTYLPTYLSIFLLFLFVTTC